MSKKFDLGKVMVTIGISDAIIETDNFAQFVNESLCRYIKQDWGDTCEEDAKQNDEAVENGDRIHAVYKKENWTIWIITEWDRSVTTILFPEEY